MFGFVKKSIFLSNLVQLLGANGVDFNEVIAKTRSTSEAKANEVRMINDQVSKEIASAIAEHEKAIAAAQSALDSVYKDVDVKIQSAAKLEAEAIALAKSADYFSV